MRGTQCRSRLGWMSDLCLRVGFGSCDRLQAVTDERQDHGEAFHGATGTAGQVDDESASSESCDAAREPRHRIVLGTLCAHRFSDSGSLAIDDATGGFRSPIARTEAGTTGGENQVGALATPLDEAIADLNNLVGDQRGLDLDIRPSSPKERDESRS